MQRILLSVTGEYEAASEKFQDGIELAPALSIQHSMFAMAEIGLGNMEEAARALGLAETLLGENRTTISLIDIAYGYDRVGDSINARRIFDEVSAAVDQGLDIGAGGWVILNLAVGNDDQALDWLRRGPEKASRSEPDVGYYSLMNLRMSYAADPVLDWSEFVEVRSRLESD
ncbi:MAG: hypothetical protein PVH89_07540 [Gammaproteobacteria bacterium]